MRLICIKTLKVFQKTIDRIPYYRLESGHVLSLTSCVSAMSSHFTYMLLVLLLHLFYVFAACLASLVVGGSP